MTVSGEDEITNIVVFNNIIKIFNSLYAVYICNQLERS